MKMSDLKCCKCGDDMLALTRTGRYLERDNAKGELFIGRCAPSCNYRELKPTADSSLLNAIEGGAS